MNEHLLEKCLITDLTIQDTLPLVHEYKIHNTDSISYSLFLVYNKHNEPSHFVRYLQAPVCHTGECLPVEINLYWDLLGNYLRFDLPHDKILTKLDHIPFTQEDYRKLHLILKNEHSILKGYQIDELVGGKSIPMKEGVDAVTGATLNTIKSEVIDGAVYTCYTLWHYVHGPVKDSIVQILQSFPMDQFIPLFLRSNHHPYLYWASDQIVEREQYFHSYLHPLIEKINGPNIFFGNYILQSLNTKLLSVDSIQTSLLEIYDSVPYRLQKHILKKLQNVIVTDNNLEKIATWLSTMNLDLFKTSIGIFMHQTNLPISVVNRLAIFLEHAEFTYREQAYRVLKNIPNKSIRLQEKLEKFKHD